MPASHHRHKPKHHHTNHPSAGPRKKITAALFMAGIGGLFGVSFGYFTGDRSVLWSMVGLLVGIGLGYFFGAAIDRSVRSKKS
jgi:hypothetical protein